jgi:hypothetical protein
MRLSMSRISAGVALAAACLGPGVACASGTPAFMRADWKSWLHGDPPAPPKAAAPATLARVSVAPDVPSDPRIEAFLQALARGIKDRDARALRPLLSQRYTVDDAPDSVDAAALFAQAIEQLPGPVEIVLTGIEARGDVRIARVEFRYADGAAKQRQLRFDVDGRLVASDLFSVRRHGA